MFPERVSDPFHVVPDGIQSIESGEMILCMRSFGTREEVRETRLLPEDVMEFVLECMGVDLVDHGRDGARMHDRPHSIDLCQPFRGVCEVRG